MGYGRVEWDIVNLASCEHHFIKVHENLMQHPSNYEPTRRYFVKEKHISSFYVCISIILLSFFPNLFVKLCLMDVVARIGSDTGYPASG